MNIVWNVIAGEDLQTSKSWTRGVAEEFRYSNTLKRHANNSAILSPSNDNVIKLCHSGLGFKTEKMDMVLYLHMELFILGDFLLKLFSMDFCRNSRWS